MTVSRTEIQRKEFRTSLRGYNMEEVDRFLDEVARELDRLTTEKKELLARIELLENKVAESEEMKSAIQDALLFAQKAAEDIKKSAQSEAESILQAAREKADTEIRDLNREKKAVQREIEKLRDVQGQIKERTRSFLGSLLSSLDAVDIMEGIVFPEVLEEERESKEFFAQESSEIEVKIEEVAAKDIPSEAHIKDLVEEELPDELDFVFTEEPSAEAKEVAEGTEKSDLQGMGSDSLSDSGASFKRKGGRKKTYPKIADEELVEKFFAVEPTPEKKT